MSENVVYGLADVMALRQELAEAAQRTYDAWQQDENGEDEEFGTGGICHLVADAMLEVLWARLPDLRAASKMVNNEVHVNVTVAVAEGVYELDVPYALYETGGGYTWTKRPGVRFEAEDVTLMELSANPEQYWMFVDDEEPEEEYAPSP